MSLEDLVPLIREDQISPSFDNNQIDLIYERFRGDFIKSPFEVNGKKILIIERPSKIKMYVTYAETFVHIITRGVTEGRLYDCNRANRVHWIKPILMSHPCNDVKYYRWRDDKGDCKEHYWYFAKDFMVVLKDISQDVLIVTAFCVDKNDKAKYYERFVDFRDGNGTC